MWDKLIEWIHNPSTLPEFLGWVGQAMFFLAWGVQWYVQTKLHRNIVPLQFWVLRFVGACFLLASSVAHDAKAISFGFIFGLVFYGYNISIFKKLSGDHATPAAG